MSAMHQPFVSSKVSSSSHERNATWQRTAVRLAAWLEIFVGASFVLALDAQSQFIYGATTEGPGVPFARFSGVALIALGIACLPSNVAATRQAARNLLLFNIAATIFFAWVAVATSFQGIGLWFVVILHTVVAIALALSLRSARSSM